MCQNFQNKVRKSRPQSHVNTRLYNISKILYGGLFESESGVFFWGHFTWFLTWRTNVTGYYSPGKPACRVADIFKPEQFLLIHCDRYKTTGENMLSSDKGRSQVARMSSAGDRDMWVFFWRVTGFKGALFSFYIQMTGATVLMHIAPQT